MTISNTFVSLDGIACLQPSDDYYPAARKANSYWNPSGVRPGKAFVLVLGSTANALRNNQTHRLTFYDGSNLLNIYDLLWVKAKKVSRGEPGPKSAYLVELVDRRAPAWFWGDDGKIFNVRTPNYGYATYMGNTVANEEGNFEDDDYEQTPYDWQDIFANIWHPSLGTMPNLPEGMSGLTTGNENIHYHGEKSMAYFEKLANLVGLRLTYDPVHNIFEWYLAGQERTPPPSLAEIPTVNEAYLDGHLQGIQIPRNIDVYFSVHNRGYGKERDAFVRNNWLNNHDDTDPEFSTCWHRWTLDTGLGIPDTRHAIWVPASIPRKTNGDLDVNSIVPFATWVAQTALEEFQIETRHTRRLGLHYVIPDGKIKSVLYMANGTGITTEFAEHSGPPVEWQPGEDLDAMPGRMLDTIKPSWNERGMAQYPRTDQVVQIEYDSENRGKFATPIQNSKFYRAWLATGAIDEASGDYGREPCIVQFVNERWNPVDDIGVKHGNVYIARRYGSYNRATSGEDDYVPLYLASQHAPIEFVLITDESTDGAGLMTGLLQVWINGSWTTVEEVKVLDANAT